MGRYSPAQFRSGRSPARLPEFRPGATDLQPGEVLRRGQQITSNDGRYRVVFQTDGNVVLYETGTGRAIWATNTPGSQAQQFIMQTDGNLVLYAGTSTQPSAALWAAGTQGHPGTFAILQDDGNFVLYSGSQALWSSRSSRWRA
jgi:hypothetical protein